MNQEKWYMPVNFRGFTCTQYLSCYSPFLVSLCRKTFVWENFPFFSTLLVEILGRCYHLDLKSENHIMLLYRTAKVYSLGIS